VYQNRSCDDCCTKLSDESCTAPRTDSRLRRFDRRFAIRSRREIKLYQDEIKLYALNPRVCDLAGGGDYHLEPKLRKRGL